MKTAKISYLFTIVSAFFYSDLQAFVQPENSQDQLTTTLNLGRQEKIDEAVEPVPDSVDILNLLKKGRIVHVPKNCLSFADFLEELALQADTTADGSFITSRYGRWKRAPRISIESGPALEILAEALDGTEIPMTINQEGYWCFSEAGDKSKKICYAASGGLLCQFEGFNCRDDQSYIWVLGRIYCEPAVQKNIASIQSGFTVVEAIDNRGRSVPVPKSMRLSWDDSGQIEINLERQQPPAKSIKKLRVKTNIALATKWITFTIKGLDFSEQLVHEEGGLRIEVSPAREISGRPEYSHEIPVEIRNDNVLDIKEQVYFKNEFFFITADGKKIYSGCGGSFQNKSLSKLNIRADFNSFDPATTSLVIKLPAAIVVEPFEFTFNNVPIIQRRNRDTSNPEGVSFRQVLRQSIKELW